MSDKPQWLRDIEARLPELKAESQTPEAQAHSAQVEADLKRARSRPVRIAMPMLKGKTAPDPVDFTGVEQTMPAYLKIAIANNEERKKGPLPR